MTKVKNLLILILIYIIGIVIILFPALDPLLKRVNLENIGDFTLLVPFEYEILDLIYIYIIQPIIMILFIFIFTTLISPLLLKLHKIVKRNRYEYFVLTDAGEDLCLRALIFRGLLLGFLAFSLGMVLSTIMPQSLTVPENPSAPIDPYYFVNVWAMFLLPFLILIIAPIWLLKDSGVMTMRKEIRKQLRQLPDIEGAYNLFNSSINGYVGIGAIFSMVMLMVNTINSIQHLRIIDIINVLNSPFILGIVAFLPVAIYELYLNRMRTNIQNKLESQGFNKINSIKEMIE